MDNREYKTIEEFYKGKEAKRSGQPYMNHIDEGIEILKLINASEEAIKAFCLHPIVQTGWHKTIDVSWSSAFELSKEYRVKANSYLCCPKNDYIETIHDVYNVVGTMSKDCSDMLYADKVQNRTDFLKYHKGIHKRSNQLDKYFSLWLEFLRSDLHEK